MTQSARAPYPGSEPAAEEDALFREVIAGLSAPHKTLPTRLLYDERGSQLFDAITELDEYYLTRTETAIMRRHAPEMARVLGPRALLIEFGSGSSTKTRILLDHLVNPAGYVPVDISREHLLKAAVGLRIEYPGLQVMPVSADFTAPFPIPHPSGPVSRRIVYFPGSTIGNFTVADAAALLQRMAAICGPGGGVLIGVDLDKDPEVLHAAYNDSSGVTAAFNLNMLERLNREFGADFDPAAFTHRAVYNRQRRRIEMHLDSRKDQAVTIRGRRFHLSRSESILTEYSHKYTVESFGELAGAAGFTPRCVWTDPDELFSVQFLVLEQA